MATANPTQYELLIAQLNNLVGQVNVFVNGTPDQVVTSQSGPIKSLAGLQKKLLQTKYVQQVSDYPKLVVAQKDATTGNLSAGNLVRVFGESDPHLNAYYQVQSDASLLKIDFRDIYDLNDYLPDALNYKRKLFWVDDIKSTTQDSKTMLTQHVQNAQTKTFYQALSGKIVIESSVKGKSGIAQFDFTLNVGCLNQKVKSNFSIAASNLLADNSFPTAQPYLSVAAVSSGTQAGYTDLIYIINWDGAASFSIGDPVSVDVTLKGIDSRNFF